MFDALFDFIRSQYPGETPVALHRPLLGALEKQYLGACIDSTFVSSVGPDIAEFEQGVAAISGHQYCIATVNGTAALQLGLILAGVDASCEVIIQPLTFVATANAIRYCGATPVFVDIETSSLGICAASLRRWLRDNTESRQGGRYNKFSGRRVAACLCMHTFGHPSRMDDLLLVCREFGLSLLEDGAEALGSRYRDQHVGHHGYWMALSFNGNKIITSGGGGALLTNNEELAMRAKHLGTTAKVPHAWETVHDQLGYNFRLPNVNAALGRAQLQRFDAILADKRRLAQDYQHFLQESGLQESELQESELQESEPQGSGLQESGPQGSGLQFLAEPADSQSNYWLNAVLCRDSRQRDQLLSAAQQQQLQLRPAWTLLNQLAMYRDCPCAKLTQAESMAARLVNLPSSARGHILHA